MKPPSLSAPGGLSGEAPSQACGQRQHHQLVAAHRASAAGDHGRLRAGAAEADVIRAGGRVAEDGQGPARAAGGGGREAEVDRAAGTAGQHSPAIIGAEKGAAVAMLVIVSGAGPVLVRVILRLPLSPMAILPKLTLLPLSITAPVMEMWICTDLDRYETEYCVGVAPVKVTVPKVPVIADAVSTSYVPLVAFGERAIFRVPASDAASLTATLELPPELIEASKTPEVLSLPPKVAYRRVRLRHR